MMVQVLPFHAVKRFGVVGAYGFVMPRTMAERLFARAVGGILPLNEGDCEEMRILMPTKGEWVTARLASFMQQGLVKHSVEYTEIGKGKGKEGAAASAAITELRSKIEEPQGGCGE